VTDGDHVDAVLEEQLHGLQVALLLVLAPGGRRDCGTVEGSLATSARVGLKNL